LFALPVDGNPDQTRWVLDVDINPGAVAGGSGGQYFVGTFDGTTFVNENSPATTLWADYGKDFYATISFSDIPPTDGRRIWMAWISNWQYANEEPTVIWRGAQSVPRELALRRLPGGIRLVQQPVAELRALRTSPDPVALVGPTPLPESAEIALELLPGSWDRAGVRLSNDAGEEAIVGMSSTPLEVFIDRRKSRLAPFHREYPGRHAGPLRWRDGTVTLRVLFDRSVVEVFANDGETVITDRLFPTKPLDRVELLDGGRPRRAQMWTLDVR
jgi:sucrose-6-phosphate hydrolase SacC (GH32 family)